MSDRFTLTLEQLRAAGEPTRLRILALLRERDLSVGEIVQILSLSQFLTHPNPIKINSQPPSDDVDLGLGPSAFMCYLPDPVAPPHFRRFPFW